MLERATFLLEVKPTIPDLHPLLKVNKWSDNWNKHTCLNPHYSSKPQ